MHEAMSAKEQALEVIKNLPDDVTFDDIEYHIYVQNKVEKAREAVARGEIVSHEEAVERLKKWRTK
jgi:hypothetical protein